MNNIATGRREEHPILIAISCLASPCHFNIHHFFHAYKYIHSLTHVFFMKMHSENKVVVAVNQSMQVQTCLVLKELS